MLGDTVILLSMFISSGDVKPTFAFCCCILVCNNNYYLVPRRCSFFSFVCVFFFWKSFAGTYTNEGKGNESIGNRKIAGEGTSNKHLFVGAPRLCITSTLVAFSCCSSLVSVWWRCRRVMCSFWCVGTLVLARGNWLCLNVAGGFRPRSLFGL